MRIVHADVSTEPAVIVGACGARPNGVDRFVWRDPQERDERLRVQDVTCPRCLDRLEGKQR